MSLQSTPPYNTVILASYPVTRWCVTLKFPTCVIFCGNVGTFLPSYGVIFAPMSITVATEIDYLSQGLFSRTMLFKILVISTLVNYFIFA